MEYGIFKPDQPTEHFILHINEDGTEEIRPEVDQEEQFEETGEMEQEETQQNEEPDQQQNKEDQCGTEEEEIRNSVEMEVL